MIEIKHISEVPEHIDIIAQWMCDEWGTDNNIEFFKSIVGHSLDKIKLPQTLVALDRDVPIGTVGIWRCDMVSRQDLYPWLSGLYVVPSYRSKGIGSKLQRSVEIYAGQLGYKKLYLYTDIENYYEKSGWLQIDKGITYSGDYNNIYAKIIKNDV